MPFGGPVVGLGLWNSLPATVVVEGLMFALGLYLYKVNTEPVDKVGSGALVALRARAGGASTRPAYSARRRQTSGRSPTSVTRNGC